MAGRPTEYKEAYCNGAAKLAKLGATDAEIADFFEVNVSTIYRWKNTHEAFCEALKVGKAECDARVVRSLFHRAVGYDQEAVKIFMPAGATEPVYAPYTERIAPDTTAAIFWLKNRNPAEWRDRAQVEHTGAIKAEVTTDAAFAQLASLVGGFIPATQGGTDCQNELAKDGKG